MKTHKTTNPRPKTWHVFVIDEYEQITNRWEEVAKTAGTPIFMLDGYHKELETAVCATFETRKAARDYIKSIGGTWK